MIAVDWGVIANLRFALNLGQMFNYNSPATFLAKEIYSQIKLAGVENHTG